MPKLDPTKKNKTITPTAKVARKVRAIRISPAVIQENELGEITYQLGYVPSAGNKRKFSPCTYAVYMRERGTGEDASDAMALRGKAEYIIGLDAEGVCVRLDVVKLLPILSAGVHAEGDPPEDTYKLHLDEETGSYTVEEAPRGVVFRDVDIMLNLLDKSETIYAGLQLNKALQVTEVNPPYIKIRRPVPRRSVR